MKHSAPQVQPPFSVRVDTSEELCHIVYRGRVTGVEMVRAIVEMIEQLKPGHSPDVIWDCSRVDAHIISPDEFAEMSLHVLSREWGHHAIIYSRAEHEDIISDLFRRHLENKGKHASTHLSMQGALLQLGLQKLPESFEVIEASDARGRYQRSRSASSAMPRSE